MPAKHVANKCEASRFYRSSRPYKNPADHTDPADHEDPLTNMCISCRSYIPHSRVQIIQITHIPLSQVDDTDPADYADPADR